MEIKPGLKEAEDGLDLTRNQGYKAFYQPRSFERILPIDNYYDILKEKPGDDATRFLLVDALLKANRLEEAQQQIIYLQPNYQEDSRFKRLLARLTGIKNDTYSNKIEEYKAILKENPDDTEIVRVLAEYYTGAAQYTEAEDLLKSYLEHNPNDIAMRFFYAQVLSFDKKLEEAYSEIQRVMEKDKEPINHKLLAGQLGVWLEKDTLETKSYLEDILKAEPENANALVALGTYNFQKLHLDSAQVFAEKAKMIDPENPNLIQLISVIETQKQRDEQERLWKQLEIGQNLAKEGKYTEAKPYYEEVITKSVAPSEVYGEYASIQMKLKDYKSAIPIYDSLLVKSSNFNYDKERGKAYLFSGDSLRSATEFERLAKDNPDDIESQVYLADSYAKLKKYDQARKIYKKIENTAPEEYAIGDRIYALPPEPGTFRSFINSFSTDIFSYLSITPVGYYFSDNLDYDYLYGGVKAETSLNNCISIGGEFLRGTFSNPNESVYYNTYKGSIFIKTSERTSIGFSYGKMLLQGKENIPVIDAFINVKGREYFSASLNYRMSDGAAVLLSPFLVNNRIKAHSVRFDAAFNYEDKLKAYGYYNLILTEKADMLYNKQYQSVKSNVGNYFMARLGKAFYPEFFLGYEYYYADFKNSVPMYYTPEEFSSHSLWAEWQVTKDSEWDVLLGGKVGYVPQNDYILREGNLKILYSVSKNLKLEVLGLIGDTVRDNMTYKSGSLNVSAFWLF